MSSGINCREIFVFLEILIWNQKSNNQPKNFVSQQQQQQQQHQEIAEEAEQEQNCKLNQKNTRKYLKEEQESIQHQFGNNYDEVSIYNNNQSRKHNNSRNQSHQQKHNQPQQQQQRTVKVLKACKIYHNNNNNMHNNNYNKNTIKSNKTTT